MEWPIVVLTITLSITVLGFLWGIIKTFKKDKTWEAPTEKIKNDLLSEIAELKETLQIHNSEIHDLSTHNKNQEKHIDDIKKDLDKVSDKCEKILDKMIDWISKE